jgi:cytosine/adenosine deaminase-related metal-dependent hydrolase
VKRILVRGAYIVTMAPAVEEGPDRDLLIEDDRIVAVGRNLAAADAEVIDGAGRIVVPGFVNAHMHTWQTALRGLAANWSLFEYMRWMHAGLATRFKPEDIHIATLVGALNQMHCGTTTLVDWCHNNPTPAHTDAAVAALFASGIRSAFLHGSPKPDPKPGEPHFSEVPHPRREIERLMKGPFAGRDQLVTLGMAILGPNYSTLDVTLHDFRLGRELGLVVSMHQGGGGPMKAPGAWEKLDAEGLLDRNVNIVHGNNLTDDQLRRMIEQGVTFSVAAEGELTQGHGVPITGRLLRLGGAPSLGIDAETLASGGMFTVARAALGVQRFLDSEDHWQRTREAPTRLRASTRDALRWITAEGARVLGMEDRIGTLTPGKQADVAIVSTAGLGMWPVHDPITNVIMHASAADIESVLIAGKFVKRDGHLLAGNLDRERQALAASGQRILDEMGIRTPARG